MKGCNAIVPERRLVAVSTTEMESELPFATKRRCDVSSQATPDGCSPTAIVAVTLPVSRSMCSTVPLDATPRSSTSTWSAFGSEPVAALRPPGCGGRPPQLLTQATELSWLTATANGAIPVLTLETTSFE